VTPQQTLKYTTEMAEQLEKAKRQSVFVGLPAEKVGGKVYGDGMTVIRIGAIHEFGVPKVGIPQRSFLRVPFRIKQKEMNKAIAKQFEEITNGRKVDIALGRIGVIATNISKGAFRSDGYGEWEPNDPETIARKGSSTTLVDTGILRSSITWVVRG